MKYTLIILTCLFLGLNSCIDPGKTKEKPNIVFLLCDDLRWNAMGHMGNEFTITPNIDELAHESVRFQYAYHVSPVCMPSRASIMLGQYLGTHGSGFNRPSNYIVTAEEYNSSYPAVLKSGGYYTGFIGKFGFAVGEGEKIDNHKLEDKEEYMPKAYFDRWYGFPGQGSYRPRKDGTFNGYENSWDAEHLNEFMGYQAIEFIEDAKASGKPFCLSVSFKAPHAPFDPEKKFRELYDDMQVDRMNNDLPEYFENLPRAVREKSRNAKWYFGRHKPPREDWHIELDEVYQEFIKNYYALITGVDDVVGRIREELEDAGLAENTVVIFTSDNGFFCGSRQLMGKVLLYDESTRAPMIIYDPRTMKGKESRIENGLISHVDIAPTILEIAGMEKPATMQGESFLPLVMDETEEIHEAVYGENNFNNWLPQSTEVEDPDSYISIRSKFVRTKEYKYIRYHECKPVVEELWNMTEDPMETKNLVNDPDHQDVLKEMREKLDKFDTTYVHFR